MSDDIFSITTAFPDVATLAQGYINRADGERLLVPLPTECAEGVGVRFVIYLADGTPAFAGAGLCVQVSDQGSGVPADQRFESLLDTLQFDERSRPVYDYIVAVRSAAYAQPGEAQDAAAAQFEEVAEPEPHEEATALLVSAGDVGPSIQPEPWSESGAPIAAEVAEPVGDAFVAADEAIARQPSFIPPPLPTGLLTRPAQATHWQPLPPRRPTPRPSSGQFRYGSGLPKPARPPYPEIDPARMVQPAPRP